MRATNSGAKPILRLEQRADAAPAGGRRRFGLGWGLAVGAGIVGRVHQRNHGRHDRRHVGARRAPLIRHRRRADAALSSPTSEERAAGVLLARARRLLLFRARRTKLWLIRARCSFPLPVYGETVR